MGVPNNFGYNRIGMFDLFDDGEDLWFTSIEFNALFKVNQQTSKMEYVGSFPNEEWNGYRLYTSVNEWEGKLFFTPCTACEIGVYDTIKKEFKKVNIGLSKQDNDISQIKYAKKFVSGFIHNDTLVLIPCCYDKVITYDLIQDKVYESDELVKYFYTKYKSSIMSAESEFYFCWYAKRMTESEIVFELHHNRNIAVIYNLATGEFKEKEIGDKNRTYVLTEYDGKYTYLYDGMADILVRWEMSTDEVVEYPIEKLLPEFQSCGLYRSFVNMVVFDGWLYLIPVDSNVAVKLRIGTMDAFIVDVLSEECLVEKAEPAYMGVSRVSNGKLYLFANRTKRIVALKEDKLLQTIETEISSEDECRIEENHKVHLICYTEQVISEDVLTLNDFLNILVDKPPKEYERDSKKTEAAGSRIYEYIKNHC